MLKPKPTEPLAIDYRYLAIIALPFVLGILFYGWVMYRKRTAPEEAWRCRCWRCRLAVPHFCRSHGSGTAHHCVLCPRCEPDMQAVRDGEFGSAVVETATSFDMVSSREPSMAELDTRR